MNKKISKKEKLLLVMLVSLLLSVLYYQLIYIKQKEEIITLEEKKQEVKMRYDEVMSTMASLEERENKINAYNLSIRTNSEPFYPTIVQEKIILELDQLLETNKLVANLSFNPITSEVVELFESELSKTPQSSLQPSIDAYEALTPKEEESTTESTSPETSQQTDALVNTTPPTVEQLKVGISFTGTYKNVKSFIRDIETYERKIAITNLSITPSVNDKVTGSMNLEFYAFPKFSDVDQSYLDWTIENKYGKETPFSGIGSTTNVDKTEDSSKVENQTKDFVILLKSTTSELPTFMMGLGDDSTQASYISSDNEEIEEVTLTLTQEKDVYYYAYKNGAHEYPLDNKPEVFTPGDNILVQINSEKRLTADDVSGIQLHIINKTDTPVKVTVEDDDVDHPRVNVIGEGSHVSVEQK